MYCKKHGTKLGVLGYSLDWRGYVFCPACYKEAGYTDKELTQLRGSIVRSGKQ